MLSANDKHQLRKMLENNTSYTDCTEKIRENQHSGEIRRCIDHILQMKAAHPTLLKTDKEAFHTLIMDGAGFLFFHYMPIYNLVLKDVDTTILFSLLNVLKQIEEGVYDQNEGSFVVGKLLKELYIDSLIDDPVKADAPTLTWQEYKRLKA